MPNFAGAFITNSNFKQARVHFYGARHDEETMTQTIIHTLIHTRRLGSGAAVALAAALLILGAAGCSKSAPPATQSATQPAQVPANAKVYHLHGKVISIDQANS